MIHTSDSHGAYESLLGLVFACWYVAVLSNLTDFEPFLVVPTLTPLVGINGRPFMVRDVKLVLSI